MSFRKSIQLKWQVFWLHIKLNEFLLLATNCRTPRMRQLFFKMQAGPKMGLKMVWIRTFHQNYPRLILQRKQKLIKTVHILRCCSGVRELMCVCYAIFMR
ncbi:MAG: hypothetical protein B7Z81_00285 [Acidocella sp. 20-61-6]|nr:MAG: hypothetical protein B7Z81_00285 [Acidocella sp. 20-61-6]